MVRPRLIPALLAILVLALPALAAADGDPASDVLLGVNVFYPYSPQVSRPLQHTLDDETRAAAKAGFPIKVALIASPVDLGVVPDLFGKPQRYADFLDQEISYQRKEPLLVVMPAGYGVQGLPAAATSAVGSLPLPQGKSTDALARAALSAVARMARAAGHPIPGYGNGGGGGGSSGLIIVLVALAVVVAAAVAALRWRRRAATPPASGTGAGAR